MYTFIEETDMNAYDEYIKANGGQYIQCSRWQKVKTTWKCTYYSGFEGEKRVLAVLVMERDLPAAGKIWYAPAGPVCDLENNVLLEEFTAFMKELVRKNGITAFIMDPDVPSESTAKGRKTVTSFTKGFCHSDTFSIRQLKTIPINSRFSFSFPCLTKTETRLKLRKF